MDGVLRHRAYRRARGRRRRRRGALEVCDRQQQEHEDGRHRHPQDREEVALAREQAVEERDEDGGGDRCRQPVTIGRRSQRQERSARAATSQPFVQLLGALLCEAGCPQGNLEPC